MALLAPGLWLQRLTTREPTLDQIEVSIRALQEVLRVERTTRTAASRSWPDVGPARLDDRGAARPRVGELQ